MLCLSWFIYENMDKPSLSILVLVPDTTDYHALFVITNKYLILCDDLFIFSFSLLQAFIIKSSAK